jgi:hypothetical protein
MLGAMRTVFVCVVLAVTAARAAADCAEGNPIYTHKKAELHRKGVHGSSIGASGSWVNDGGHGCLSPARLKLVEDAIAAAKFERNDKARRCRVAAVWHVTVAAPARKKSIEHDEPCGVPFDAATSAMIACADAVVDASVSDDDATKACTSR